MSNVVVLFERGKETKNKIVFEEVVDDGEQQAVGSLYVWKHVVKHLGEPTRLTVTIEAN